MRFYLAAVAVAFVALAAPIAHAHGDGDHVHVAPPWQDASLWPDRIVVTFAGDPARTLAVSWRTDASVTAAEAQIARALPDARFDLASTTHAADSEALDPAALLTQSQMVGPSDIAGMKPVRYHSVLFEGLEPDTLYAYRVRGAEGRWSEWFQIRTAQLTGPVTFLYLGDAQNGILSHWARAVRAAYATAPDARFILHAGDLVNRGSRDFEWAEWFKSVGFIHGMVPAVPVAGNHEYVGVGADPQTAQRVLTALWRPQFRLPVEAGLPPEMAETAYQMRYSRDLHVFVLDTNADLDPQAAWLEAQVRASDARWKIVSFHHPVFSSGKDRDDPRRRSVLLPLFDRLDVDLVLQGHDHTYARGALHPELAPQTPERVAAPSRRRGTVGPMFVTSISGAKQYVFRATGWDDYRDEGVRLDRRAENTQFFQVIRIDGDRLSYEARMVDGQLYDAFVMEKRRDGSRRMLSGPVSTVPERRFSNTMPYPGVEGLDD